MNATPTDPVDPQGRDTHMNPADTTAETSCGGRLPSADRTARAHRFHPIPIRAEVCTTAVTLGTAAAETASNLKTHASTFDLNLDLQLPSTVPYTFAAGWASIVQVCFNSIERRFCKLQHLSSAMPALASPHAVLLLTASRNRPSSLRFLPHQLGS